MLFLCVCVRAFSRSPANNNFGCLCYRINELFFPGVLSVGVLPTPWGSDLTIVILFSLQIRILGDKVVLLEPTSPVTVFGFVRFLKLLLG